MVRNLSKIAVRNIELPVCRGGEGARLAARGGTLRVGRLRLADGAKVAAAETPLRAGDVLG